MEVNHPEFDKQPEFERQIDQHVSQLQYFIDQTKQDMLSPDMSETEQELAIIDLRTVVDQEIEVLNSLDPNLGRDVRVSGRIYRSYHDDMTGQDRVEAVDVQSELMESSGFTVYGGGDRDEFDRETVGYLFHNKVPIQIARDNSLVHQVKVYYSFAPYGSVAIERPRTDQEVVERLEQFAPDKLFAIEQTLLNAESPEQAIVGLANFSYCEGELDETTQVCLVRYANQTIGLPDERLLRVGLEQTYQRTVLGTPLSLSLWQNRANLAIRANELTLTRNEEDPSDPYRWTLKGQVYLADSANQNIVNVPDLGMPVQNISHISQLTIDNNS